MEEKIKAIEDAIWKDAEAMARKVIFGESDMSGFNVEDDLSPILALAFDYVKGMFAAMQKVRKAFDLPTVDHLEAFPIPDHLRTVSHGHGRN